jgi:hypothetical protein
VAVVRRGEYAAAAVSGCLCSRLTASQLGAANTLLARPVPLLTSALPALHAAGGRRCCQGVEARLNGCCVTLRLMTADAAAAPAFAACRGSGACYVI